MWLPTLVAIDYLIDATVAIFWHRELATVELLHLRGSMWLAKL
jgi:hypothetical protein